VTPLEIYALSSVVPLILALTAYLKAHTAHTRLNKITRNAQSFAEFQKGLTHSSTRDTDSHDI
jgi:hypothetical protein